MFIVYNVEFLCNVTQKKNNKKKTIVLVALGEYESYFRWMKYGCIQLAALGGNSLELSNSDLTRLKRELREQSVVRGLELATWWSIGEGGIGGVRGCMGGGGVGGVWGVRGRIVGMGIGVGGGIRMRGLRRVGGMTGGGGWAVKEIGLRVGLPCCRILRRCRRVLLLLLTMLLMLLRACWILPLCCAASAAVWGGDRGGQLIRMRLHLHIAAWAAAAATAAAQLLLIAGWRCEQLLLMRLGQCLRHQSNISQVKLHRAWRVRPSRKSVRRNSVASSCRRSSNLMIGGKLKWIKLVAVVAVAVPVQVEVQVQLLLPGRVQLLLLPGIARQMLLLLPVVVQQLLLLPGWLLLPWVARQLLPG